MQQAQTHSLCILYTHTPDELTALFQDLQSLQLNADRSIYQLGDVAALYTLALWFDSREDLNRQLMNTTPEQWHQRHTHPIAFLCTGQGSQYPHMCQHLYTHEPAFRGHFDQAADAVNQYLELNIQDIILSDDPSLNETIHQTAYTQPALFVVEYALAHLWMDYGVYPNIIMGHSVGEFAAATIAGVLSLNTGAALITRRAQLMQSLPAQGSMAALMSDLETLAPHLQPFIESEAFDIAALNGPKQTVISGDTHAIDECLSLLKKHQIRGRPLVVSHAFHSPHMNPILDTFKTFADTYPTESFGDIRLISNVTGDLMSSAPDGTYWQTHIRSAVQFQKSVTTCLDQGAHTWIEIGPHPVLNTMAQRCLSSEQVETLHWIESAHQKQPSLEHWAAQLYRVFNGL
ncbi:MAG: hypothetical protein CMF51_01075 [Legionellales bacterium]|nr:hypothetical protein [Legionellales bacterium]|tara:strand:+ start:1523 stop:2731 length:1209 start_codon:yes stop_codon:yes gene_type:complete